MKKYIITTGDISDFDGFLTFPMYKKIAIKEEFDAVVFIMNYPAYFKFEDRIGTFMNEKEFNDQYPNKDDKNQFGIDLPYKGYKYSYKDFFYYHYNFFTKIGIIRPDNSLINGMKELAFNMCKNIWKSIEGNMDLIFIDGGINEINPGSLDFIKNEFKLYYRIINTTYAVPYQYIHYYDLIDFFNNINIDDEIYMDMNGSFAFCNNVNFKSIMTINKFKSIKALSIMGGVYNNTLVQTLSLPFLNRLTSATMNQLYAPKATNWFLNNLVQYNKSCKIFIVSNNYINDVFSWSNKEDFIKYINECKLLNDEDIYMNLFFAYYNDQSKFKPFDIVSAFVLIKAILNETSYIETINNYKNLLYNHNYGICIIDKTQNTEKDIFLSSFCSQLTPEIYENIQYCEKIYNSIASKIITYVYNLYIYYINGISIHDKQKENDRNFHKHLITEFNFTDFLLLDVYDIDNVTREDIKNFMLSTP
jgi:hypothetical protein